MYETEEIVYTGLEEGRLGRAIGTGALAASVGLAGGVGLNKHIRGSYNNPEVTQTSNYQSIKSFPKLGVTQENLLKNTLQSAVDIAAHKGLIKDINIEMVDPSEYLSIRDVLMSALVNEWGDDPETEIKLRGQEPWTMLLAHLKTVDRILSKDRG